MLGSLFTLRLYYTTQFSSFQALFVTDYYDRKKTKIDIQPVHGWLILSVFVEK